MNNRTKSFTLSDDDSTEKSQNRECQLHQKKAKVAEEERQSLARKETKAVNALKIAAFSLLVVTAVVSCTLIYLYTQAEEQNDFDFVYESSAKRVMQSFHDSVSNMLIGADTLSVSITSYALASGSTFPNVTMPDYELRGANIRVLTKAVAANFFPLVTAETRAGWEAYATEKQQREQVQKKSFQSENQYIADADAYFGLEPVNFTPPAGGTPLLGRPFSPVITKLQGGIQNGTGPFAPYWQTSPTLSAPALTTADVFTFPPLGPAIKIVLETNQAYLSKAVNPLTMFSMFLARGQYRHQRETFQGDAATPLMYPVFTDFSQDRELAGFCFSNIYWRLHFERVLPPSSIGIIAILSNSVNQSFTYQLDGEEVTFIGKGDLHDQKFDEYEVSSDITSYLAENNGVEKQGYTSIPLTTQGVQYTLKIYPSDDFESQFITTRPLVYAGVVGAVFLFAILVFSTYNLLVERRQQIVVDRAVKSSVVVSSLFPNSIKEQLINDTATGAIDNDQKKKKKNSSKEKMEAWKLKKEHSISHSKKQRPMADKFPETTVMFADIAGFTSWSANREPAQVFELLEALYSEFDNIAARKGVFKVETIGDCYLAVTGLPEPQPDHALRMAKFARDCMHKVGTITTELMDSLGSDTAHLSFRVGLHSGPVTAGVLRGDKTRFQLFGDTVNTAARMESNGIKKRIHISQQTADQLIQAGHDDMIVPREEKIFAKGKGDLQTYFMTDAFVNRKDVTNASSLGISDETSETLDYTNPASLMLASKSIH